MTEPVHGSQPVYGSQPVSDEGSGEWSVEDRLRAQAVKNLKKRAEFRQHLVVFGLVNLLLIVIWLVSGITAGAWYPWWIYPFFGWGIGLGVQAWSTYKGDPMTEENIRQEMRRIAGS